jgi:hypothetical protein
MIHAYADAAGAGRSILNQGHPSSCDGHRVDLDAVQRTRYIAMGCSRISDGRAR